MRNKLWITLLLSALINSAFAQKAADTLFYNDFISIVKAYHPTARQANLLSELAQAKRTKALGLFEPKLEATFDQKYFDGVKYYTFLTPEIKVPLWYGLELKGGYSKIEGTYVNPQNKVPKDGLSNLGLSFSLGKGLLIDDRRASLKKAQIFGNAYKNEVSLMLNDLLLDAGTQYLDWQTKFKLNELHKDALELAMVRYKATIVSVNNGDKPAIDTVESMLTLRQRELALREASLELESSRFMLSDFLWTENGKTVDTSQLNVVPQIVIAMPATVIDGVRNNPKLVAYNFKLQDLAIERRLKADQLKPALDVQLNVLNRNIDFSRTFDNAYWQNNNKVNVSLSFPLTFAKARGDLAEAKIKIQQTELDKLLTERELINKDLQNRFELTTLQNQLAVIKESLSLALRLTEGEEMKFKLGESSLFLINARETKVIETRQKLLLTEFKYFKAKLKNLWLSSSGIENAIPY